MHNDVLYWVMMLSLSLSGVLGNPASGSHLQKEEVGRVAVNKLDFPGGQQPQYADAAARSHGLCA